MVTLDLSLGMLLLMLVYASGGLGTGHWPISLFHSLVPSLVHPSIYSATHTHGASTTCQALGTQMNPYLAPAR